jgi:hypothetical protein
MLISALNSRTRVAIKGKPKGLALSSEVSFTGLQIQKPGKYDR